MKFLKLAVWTLLMSVAAGGALKPAAAQSWAEFRDDDGDFIALFPGSPQQAPQEYANGGRGMRLMVEVGDDEAYLLEWTDYPDALAASKPPEQHLNEAQQNTLNVFPKGEVIRQGAMVRANNPGRAFTIDTGDGLVYQGNHYWVGNRLYQLVVVTSAAKARDPKIAAFFGAFNFIER